jgi:diadenosine tetraphosphate (Ap4A) HIT family hydrolase
MSECHTCLLTARRDAGEAPPWDHILRTPSWDLAHAFSTSVEGWLVLVARRHITAVADLTDEEAVSLGPLIKQVSAALHEVVGCEKTYVVQFAEHPQHPHVRVHVIARALDLDSSAVGPGIFSRMGVPRPNASRRPG